MVIRFWMTVQLCEFILNGKVASCFIFSFCLSVQIISPLNGSNLTLILELGTISNGYVYYRG